MTNGNVDGLVEKDLIYDWNEHASAMRSFPVHPVFFDETLRDGLQDPSVVDPCIDEKIKLLHCMEAVGIEYAEVGLPGASRRSFDDVLALCREIERGRLKVRPSAAGRTLLQDVQPIVEISQRVGVPLECYLFLASSPIRQFAEDWDLESLLHRCGEAITMAVKAGLRVAFVTEDATRSRPEVLAELFKVAIDQGATRVCLADTVGHVTPEGVRAIVGYTRMVLQEIGAAHIGIDWHGHNDRGLALWNAIEAIACGAERIHATALGVGERVGNVPMELILVNLKLLGMLRDRELSGLADYCSQAARMLGWSIPIKYPVFGRDAFRTATGVHAAAIVKAEGKGHAWLADRIYSSVPASMVGRSQQIEIGYMSGTSNVVHWLRQHNLDPQPALVEAILHAAKDADHILSEHEIHEIIGQHKPR